MSSVEWKGSSRFYTVLFQPEEEVPPHLTSQFLRYLPRRGWGMNVTVETLLRLPTKKVLVSSIIMIFFGGGDMALALCEAREERPSESTSDKTMMLRFVYCTIAVVLIIVVLH
eukprot:scaffold15824_cov80-Skeletonema_marinoi.AAC.3